MKLTRSPTYYVVGGLIGTALMTVAFVIGGWKIGLALSIILAYEAWTLVNKWQGDTISEIIWEWAERPMVPWIFGVGCGWAVTSGAVSDPYLIGAIFFLMGHFFFQQHHGRKKAKER